MGVGAVLKRIPITQPSNNILVHLNQGAQIALTCRPEGETTSKVRDHAVEFPVLSNLA